MGANFSAGFVAENTHNFAQCCVNSPRISEKFSFEKNEEERGEKGKNMLLMFVEVKLGVKKIDLVNAEIFAFNTFLTNMSK